MPDLAVFSLDEHAGRVETVTASDSEAATAIRGSRTLQLDDASVAELGGGATAVVTWQSPQAADA